MIKSVQLPYHQQDTQKFCGDAVAQMMLRSFGLPIEQQDELKARIPQMPCWSTGPIPLCQTLAAALPPPQNSALSVSCDSDLEVALARAAAALRQPNGHAVPAAVLGGAHWVALTGVATDPRDETTILGFFLNDPFAPKTHGDIHSDHDGCGLGGFSGAANTYVTVDFWRRYLWAEPTQPTPMLPQRGFVTLCADGGAPPRATPLAAAAKRGSKIDPNTMNDRAHAAIGAVRIDVDGPLKSLLQGYRPGTIVPVFGPSGEVRYYAVHLRVNDTPKAYALMDRATGALLAVQAAASFPETDPYTLNIALADLGYVNDAQAGTCYFTPCHATLSPFFPLVRFQSDGGTMYRLPNGRFQRRLTRDAKLAGHPWSQ